MNQPKQIICLKDYFEIDFDKMKKFNNYLNHNNFKKVI